jgi:hypothetical protein
MRFMNYAALNFNNSMFTVALFLDIKKAFDTAWHPGFSYKLSQFQFSASISRLISPFLSDRKFRVSVEAEMSTPQEIQAGILRCSILSPTLYNLYINDCLETPYVHLTLFADDMYIYHRL